MLAIVAAVAMGMVAVAGTSLTQQALALGGSN